MSNSSRLSETLQGNIKNKESQFQDVQIKDVVSSVVRTLREKNLIYTFGIDTKVMLRKIEEKINGTNFTSGDNTYVKPDGGFIWVKIKNKKYYILVSEQKRQGTNDKRNQEGKSKQAAGNAVERLPKNLMAFETLYGDEDIFPVIVFLQGCDFYDAESTIGDRVRTIARFQLLNQINLYFTQVQKNQIVAGSFFMRGHSMKDLPGTSDWTFNEMYEPMLTIAEKALDYFVEKYGKS